MKAVVLLATVLLCGVSALAAPLTDLAAFGYNPVANTAAVVTSGNARFTVLSPWVIRMEYSNSTTFEDRATLMAVNRYSADVPAFKVADLSNNLMSISTSAVTLTYAKGQPFTPSTLYATSPNGNWKFGDVDTKNLLGTIKSLDLLCTISLNCTENAGTRIHYESLHCGWGVVTRGAFTTIVDTGNYIMSSVQGSWFDVNARNQDLQDVYLFGHAQNYRQALQDYTNLAGKTPLMKKPMYGAWYTRWFDFDNSDIEQLLHMYETYSLPLDVLVLDMNWHKKDAWTGVSWDKQLYPFPADTISMLHHKGLLVAANIHDAEGVGIYEDTYPQIATAMGMNPAMNQTILFSPMNATYMHALEDIALAATGFDFFWIDWQQGGMFGGTPGFQLNPTFITDHVRSTNSIRRGINQRDQILARWGGMGSHRYPVGFSGDVSELSWECFAFQPYFSVTGANVAYGFISNDLVGPANDHELHVRWMQFGAFSGVLRIHDRGMSAGSCWPDCPIVNMWQLPDLYFVPIQQIMAARVALMPYMYTESRSSFDSGVPLVYPMYYDSPNEAAAYAMGPDGTNAQYMFGPSILVAPVTTAAGNSALLATKNSIFIPAGAWYDDVFGVLVTGPTTISRSYYLAEMPMFMKGGAIIPRIPNPTKIGASSAALVDMDISIYPGLASNSYAIYDDDGTSLDYIRGASGMITTVSYSFNSQTQVTVVVEGVVGATPVATSRIIRLFLVGRNPIASVTVNGNALAYSQFGDTLGSFTYDGKTGTAIVNMGSTSNSQTQTVVVTFATAENPVAMTAGISGLKGRAARSWLAKRTTDDYRVTPYSTIPGVGQLKVAGARAVELSHLASPASSFSQFNAAATAYPSQIAAAITELNQGTYAPVPDVGPMLYLAQLWSYPRGDMLLCGTTDCLNVNSDYQVLWAEGYQPANGAAGGIPLYDYFDSGNNDNWATTNATTPDPGYAQAIFSNGFVFSPPNGKYTTASLEAAGKRCLQVWFSNANQDHMTLASPEAVRYATAKGYFMVKPCIALVNIEPEAASAETSEALLRRIKDIMAAAREEKAKLHKQKIGGGALTVVEKKAEKMGSVDYTIPIQYLTNLPN